MKYHYFAVEKRADGAALVWLDYPNEKINKLSSAMVTEFEAMLAELDGDANVKAVVLISKKPDSFIVGADLDELKAVKVPADGTTLSRGAHLALNAVAASPKPVVAAIHGSCLGGGLEVALACHYRVATDHPKTQLGLPEVKLGLLPAGGGTQRLPRTVGLQAALDMMLTGKNIYARKAKKMGLVDEVVIPYALAEQAAEAALRLATGAGRKARERSLRERAMEDVGPARQFVLGKAREMVGKLTKGNYPAPPAIIDCVEVGFQHGFDAGLEKEAELFGQLLVSPASASLRQLFFGMTEKKKHPLAKGATPVKRLGVLGAGLMGAGVALVTAADAKTDVLLKDVSPEAVAAGQKYVFAEFDRRFRRKAINQVERDRLLSRIATRVDYANFDTVDLVVEAVFEDLGLKRKVLAECEAATRDDCVFASNTSALPITDIAAKAKRPENVVGMHYFSPVHRMPLLEIIATKKTSERALKMAVGLGLAQGKTIIVVQDGPGFYTTRILAPYLNETGLLLEEGATIEAIDAAMTAFGFPVGPVALMDEVGIDVGAHVAKFLGKIFCDERGIKQAAGIQKMFEAGFKGRKNQQGFYLYGEQAAGPKWEKALFWKPKKKKIPNEAAYRHFGGERRAIDVETIQFRNALVMVNEAVLCLQDGTLASPTDGDLGAILGLGFPPFRGGPFRFIDSYGAEALVKKMEALAEKHGPQFKPAELLVERAKKGKKFYSAG